MVMFMLKIIFICILIYRNFDFCNKYGYNALMTPFVWMFIKNYENLRKFIINNKSISSLIQLEYSAFSEATVPICTFVLSNFNENYIGTYLKLSEFSGGMEVQKEKVLNATTTNTNYKFYSNTQKYNNIPLYPIAYWADETVVAPFNKGHLLEEETSIKVGLQTGDVNKFIRFWFEVNFDNIEFNCTSCEETNYINKKWYPHNKGGNYRKWYGNNYHVVNWKNNGFEIKNNRNKNGKLKSRPQNSDFYFKKGLTYSSLSSGKISFRYNTEGFIFDTKGSKCFINEDNDFEYIFAFLNNDMTMIFLSFLAPTLDFNVGSLKKLPLIYNKTYDKEIHNLVHENIKLTKEEWDDYEISWDFKTHPLLKFKAETIEHSFNNRKQHNLNTFENLKHNEERLNEIFSIIYSINFDIEIKDKYVSIKKVNDESDIKSFISYAVGCMFGRYSLDQEGIQYTGGNFNIHNYSKFIPDDDNIIPVLDSEYFEDDIVGRFIEFVKICFGEENLEENLDFIANSLTKNNKSSRETIRNYLLNDFYEEHIKTYQNCPIYWQFTSGKQNGFNCLVYMHRYEPSLVARIRTDYLHKTQKAIEQKITNNDNIINNSTSKQEVTRATKEKAKLQKQLKETQEYDEVLAHIANQNIEIDLDDGVKVNYAKFQNIEIKKEGSKTKKVNLLKKI